MTTATRRLRRAGVAGLATITTVGGLLIATGGTAFAAELAVGTQIGSVTATNLYPGTTAQGVGDLQIAVPNSFAIGDTITVQLAGAGASCGTTNGAIGYSAAPSVAASGPFTAAFGATAGSTSDTTPTFTAALQSSAGACTVAGVKDQLLLTMTKSSTGTATDSFTVTVSGTKVNVGSAVTPGAVTEKPTSGAAVTVATVTNTKASLTEVSAAPSAQGVAINTLSLSEVTAGAFLPAGVQTTVTLTLAGVGTPKFTAGVTPTITVPTGYVVATPIPVTTAAATYQFKVTAPATATTATVSVAGLKVDLTAAATGIVTLTAGNPATIGAAQNAIGVLNQGRTGGIDRYATSSQLFLSGGFNTATIAGIGKGTAVLASGQAFPDALSANYLAGKLGTRTLLTDPNILQQSTLQALYSANVSTVYLLGGTAAVSQAVQNQISALHVSNTPANALIQVIRIGGADRYATNNMVDLYLGAASTGTAYVASGNVFADALAIGPAVYKTGNPLILVDGTASSLTPAAQSTLVNLGISNVIIVGGTAAVSATVEAAIHTAGPTIQNRLAGADRTNTAAAIATYETTGSGATGIAAAGTYVAVNGLGFTGNATVWLTNGLAFPDALSAGPVAGGAQNPVLLTGGPTTLGAGIPSYFAGKAATITTVNAVGLTAAVSTSVVNAAIASLS